jgi:inosose dehydratase
LEPPLLIEEICFYAQFQVGNAPCSGGTLEFEGTGGEQIGFGRMLDELAQAGYAGAKLGDWSYRPTEPDALRQELSSRGLVMLGAFVPVALKEPSALSEGDQLPGSTPEGSASHLPVN